jgi:iron complex outermembrane receptor protein
VTNGEGHNTAIRQGYSTSPLYLFLEDGIPIRATGNFNHNALYEVNIPGAGGVEVIRGIGTALYGSDAIGGTINILTKTPRAQAGKDASLEMGDHGWVRFLGGMDSGDLGQSALRGDVNLTHTEGWRIKTGYDRQSLNLRWDYEQNNVSVIKTILGYTKIDQETGANSALPLDYFLNSPRTNLRSPAYRKVDAFRLSSSIETELGQGRQLTITPYFRSNKMDLNGSYNFTGDARIENTEVASYGLMTKFRKNFNDEFNTRLIMGMDVDYSPSSRQEDKITLTSTTLDSIGVARTGAASLYSQFTGYTIGGRIYDYSVNYKNAAPYAHLEFSPVQKLRITAGLRYDYASYEMQNNLSEGFVTASGRQYFQQGSTSANYSRLSPKIGMTWSLSERDHLYASYNQGFRTPSESQLFRGGRSDSGVLAVQQAQARALSNAAVNLKAIKADQFELGLRGSDGEWNYELVTYLLTKKDDLLNQKDDTGFAVQTNNGKTQHRGVEFGLGRIINANLRLDLASSYATHTYKDWVTSSVNFSGKNIEQAPNLLLNMRLTWRPAPTTLAQIEWVKIGSYYLDAENLYGKYEGHDLLNLRTSFALNSNLTVFARVTNLFNKRYADSASATSSGALYSPGLPRTAYMGVEMKL